VSNCSEQGTDITRREKDMEKRTAKRMYRHKEGHNITVKVDIETYYRMKGIVKYDLEQGKSQSLTAIVNDLLKRYAVRRRKDAEKGLELLELKSQNSDN
jgi:hypothetical protein